MNISIVMFITELPCMSTRMRSNQIIARLIKIKTINMTHVNQGHHYTTDLWGNKCKQPVQLKRAHTKRLNFMTHTLAILVAILVSHIHPLDRISSGTTTSLSQSLLFKHNVCDGCNWCQNHEHFPNQYRYSFWWNTNNTILAGTTKQAINIVMAWNQWHL